MQTNLDDLYVKRKLNNIESLLAIILSNQNQNQTENIMLFSEYQKAVDDTLAEVLKTIGSESDQIKAILAAGSAENPAIKTAFDELNQKRATVIEALGGLITTTPVPTPPVVLPTDPGTPLVTPVVPPVDVTPVVAPVVAPGEPVAPVAPVEVPITSTPSQPGIGIPGGVDLSGTTPVAPAPTTTP